MPAIINSVEKDSIAEELELQAGDEIVSIDEQKINDLIDYNFLCKSEFLTLEIKKKNGEEEIIELEKDYDDNLGIIFESAVFDKVKPCCNKCIFCFVDQQPKGLRDTLYIKDDDYRLSYLQGTYITLTNLSAKDKKRIELLKLGPLYISVHTTNPDLRVKMLNNPNAATIYKNLKWLAKLEIPVHIQIVLCPTFNDGEELKRTLNDLSKLKNVVSIAIVPVGITKYRKNSVLKPVTKTIAKETIDIVNKFNKDVKANIACCSDEFFALAEQEIPKAEYYGDFSQLDDGVGALRLLLNDFEENSNDLPKELKTQTSIFFATSKLAKPAFIEIARKLANIKGLNVSVDAVSSDFWGNSISVAGLVTSDDLTKTLKQIKDKNTTVIISSVMLRKYTQDFLNGKTLDDVKEKTKLNFLVVKDIYSTKEIIDFIKSKA